MQDDRCRRTAILSCDLTAILNEQSHMGDWIIRDIEKVFSSMPLTGYYVDVAAAKHANRMTRWKGNDLFDMNYLACAAGYADFLVGEKATVELLRQSASRSKRTLSLHSSLGELLPELERRIA